MAEQKPGEITTIASYIAARIPTEGVDPKEATEAWRSTLRYARGTDAIAPLTDLIVEAEPGDETLRAHCETLKG